MMFGTLIVPLVLQNTTHLVGRAVESVCQNSTIVLSVSSTAITAADGSVSTSYSIFPVNKHIWQTNGFSTTTLQPSAEPTDPLSELQSPNVATYHRSTSSASSPRSGYPLPPTPSNTDALSVLSGFSHPSNSLILSTTSLSTTLLFTGSTFPSMAGFDSSTKAPDSVVVSRSSPSTDSKQTVMPTASSTNLTTAPMNPSYTCPRDNGMYYSDITNRVYQVLCNTDEPDSNLATTYQSQLQSCVDSCGTVTGCIGVSYTATSGSCSYKSSVSDRVSSSTADSAILADYICPGVDGARLVDSSGSSAVFVSDSESTSMSSPGASVSDSGPTPISSPVSFGSSFMSEELSTFVPSVITSAQASEDTALSTSDQTITVTQSSSGDDTSSGPAHGDTTVVNSGAATSDTVFTATVIDVGASLSITPHIPLPTISVFWPSITDITPSTSVADAASLIAGINTIPITIATPSSSVTCSVYDNLLDICLDATITPSIGAGGVISVGLGSSTITVVDASATLAIAPSVAASADLGISVGTGGVGVQASASIGLNFGIADSLRPTATTSVPSTSCSAGGNVLNICVDAAITPSIGLGGNAGVGVGVGSSTITLIDVSASLAIVPSVTAAVDLGLSIGSSGIGLVASATVGADLNLNSSVNATIGPLLPNTVTAAASAGLDLGPSSSALTLLQASASAAVGRDLGLSMGSSDLGLASSATMGLNLGLSLGDGQSKQTSTSNGPLSATSTALVLLPTCSVALNVGLGLGVGQSASTSLPSTSSTTTTSTPRLLSTRTVSSPTTNITRSTSTAGLVISLVSALVRQVTHTHTPSSQRQGFTTLVRVGY